MTIDELKKPGSFEVIAFLVIRSYISNINTMIKYSNRYVEQINNKKIDPIAGDIPNVHLHTIDLGKLIELAFPHFEKSSLDKKTSENLKKDARCFISFVEQIQEKKRTFPDVITSSDIVGSISKRLERNSVNIEKAKGFSICGAINCIKGIEEYQKEKLEQWINRDIESEIYLSLLEFSPKDICKIVPSLTEKEVTSFLKAFSLSKKESFSKYPIIDLGENRFLSFDLNWDINKRNQITRTSPPNTLWSALFHTPDAWFNTNEIAMREEETIEQFEKKAKEQFEKKEKDLKDEVSYKRGRALEDIAKDLLERIFLKNNVYSTVVEKLDKYAVEKEIDILCRHDDILLIVECKAKPITNISKEGDKQKKEKDLRDSIEKAAKQLKTRHTLLRDLIEKNKNGEYIRLFEIESKSNSCKTRPLKEELEILKMINQKCAPDQISKKTGASKQEIDQTKKNWGTREISLPLQINPSKIFLMVVFYTPDNQILYTLEPELVGSEEKTIEAKNLLISLINSIIPTNIFALQHYSSLFSSNPSGFLEFLTGDTKKKC